MAYMFEMRTRLKAPQPLNPKSNVTLGPYTVADLAYGQGYSADFWAKVEGTLAEAMLAQAVKDKQTRNMPSAKNLGGILGTEQTVISAVFDYVSEVGRKVSVSEVAEAIQRDKRQVSSKLSYLERQGVVKVVKGQGAKGRERIFRYIKGAQMKPRGVSVNGTPNTEVVYKAISESGGASRAQIASVLGFTDEQVVNALQSLRNSGKVDCIARGPSDYEWVILEGEEQ
jgi:Mn-dependent DtxR family transcriptional regulator